ncbi:MAG: insulinase family protein [Pedosphaera sp.]|nr:insulinase family protein [Pedosphaera sp.]
MYHVTRLSNGLTVATAEMPHMASVSLGFWAAVGSRAEITAQNGAAHFIEHMLFKGTRHRSAKKISQDIEGVGGYLNAFTAEENTCFYSRAHHNHFAELFSVLADMYLQSLFAPAELSKERDVIKEEVSMYMDQPAQRVQELLNETLWPNQPLGRPITGTHRSIDRLDRRALLAFVHAHYGAHSTLITAAGHVKHAEVVRAVKRIAARFPAGKRPVFTPADARQSAPRIKLITRKTEQTQLALGIRTCSRHDDRRHALRLLNVILGENMSSRLFQIVREDRGLAYSIYSTPSFFDDVGDLVISAGLEAEKLPQVLRLITREMRRLAETPPSAAELRRARDYLFGQLDLSLEGTENQMNWIGEQLLGYGQIIPPATVKERYAAVTAAQIRDAARDFFRPERLNLALVSPLKSDAGLARLLAL